MDGKVFDGFESFQVDILTRQAQSTRMADFARRNAALEVPTSSLLLLNFHPHIQYAENEAVAKPGFDPCYSLASATPLHEITQVTMLRYSRYASTMHVSFSCGPFPRLSMQQPLLHLAVRDPQNPVYLPVALAHSEICEHSQ